VLLGPTAQLLQQTHLANASFQVAFLFGDGTIVDFSLYSHELVAVVRVFRQVHLTIGTRAKLLYKSIPLVE